MRSRLGPPPAVVAVRRMVLAPAFSGIVSVPSVQVSQLAVGGNDRVLTAVPLTAMSRGRSAVVPLAERMVRVVEPAAAAVTANSTYEPTRLSKFTKPVPVKPGWLDST